MITPTTCKACGASIVYLPTDKGNLMPVDAISYSGQEKFTIPVNISHFATCPSAAAFRKGKSNG